MLSIITDPGVDDLVALTLLSKLSKNNNALISSFGNVALEFTDRNTKEFISTISAEWDYFKGSELPLLGKIQTPWANAYHGMDGSWNIHHQTNTAKITSLEQLPQHKQVISLAPLTDLYRLQNKIDLKTVTIMGGAFNVPGNETELAEFNIAADPESANKFFKEVMNQNVLVVPLDVTSKVNWTINQIRNIPETSVVNKWLKQLLLAWFKYHEPKTKNIFELYDPLAVYLTFFQDQAIWDCGDISVILKGVERGKTIFVHNSNSNCKVAVDLIDANKIQKEIFKITFE